MYCAFKITFLSLMLSSVMSFASAQAVQCTATDKVGSPLVGAGVNNGDGFVTCSYQIAGACTYFAANGENDSGSSNCPAGIPQTLSSSSSSASSTSSTSTTSAASTTSSVQCTPTDKAGSSLVGVGKDNGDGTVTCTYQTAGACTYFAVNGENDSGSSNCPAGIPQSLLASSTATSSSSSISGVSATLSSSSSNNGALSSGGPGSGSGTTTTSSSASTPTSTNSAASLFGQGSACSDQLALWLPS